VEVELLRPEAYFVTDLGVDSLRMLDLLLGLEKLGVPVTLESAWRIQTVGDAYAYCREQWGKGAGEQREQRGRGVGE
jgi:acyl carrier protein